MSRSPTISVITPTFNQARYLERTICSVLDQGYDKLEYIVVDGGSNDQTIDLIKTYEADLAWWISCPDAGPVQAIHKALRHATGQIVAFLSSDNLFLPFTLQRVAQRFERADRPSWLIGRSVQIDTDDRPLRTARRPLPRDLADYLRGSHDPVARSATFYRTSLVREFGPIDDSLAHHFDFDFNCRLLASGIRPALLDEPLSAHRRHVDSHRVSHAAAHRRERRSIVRKFLAAAGDSFGSSAA